MSWNMAHLIMSPEKNHALFTDYILFDLKTHTVNVEMSHGCLNGSGPGGATALLPGFAMIAKPLLSFDSKTRQQGSHTYAMT